ncbi:NAD-dependent epimerase/dehydratase family protein [Nocardia farcinica]|uniref:NAD-dependent epimerase/dehydratase family protein n=1 Tax=Nocardia farcinica TaxID=37329 RepID=UPI0024554225|nr:NAD-dependent epimerase/dehydratase family protein [Nocardia farcinica]
MTSLVTGATGFIGRFLVPALLRRGDTVHVLVPPDERGRYDTCARDWAGGERVRPVEADLDRVDPAWVRAHPGDIEHVFHHDPAPGAAPHAIAPVFHRLHITHEPVDETLTRHAADTAIAAARAGLLDRAPGRS